MFVFLGLVLVIPVCEPVWCNGSGGVALVCLCVVLRAEHCISEVVVVVGVHNLLLDIKTKGKKSSSVYGVVVLLVMVVLFLYVSVIAPALNTLTSTHAVDTCPDLVLTLLFCLIIVSLYLYVSASIHLCLRTV